MHTFEVQCDKSYRFNAFLFMENSVTDQSVALILSAIYNTEINILPHIFHAPCANTVNSTINLHFHN
jgi:hypothetical protein